MYIALLPLRNRYRGFTRSFEFDDFRRIVKNSKTAYSLYVKYLSWEWNEENKGRARHSVQSLIFLKKLQNEYRAFGVNCEIICYSEQNEHILPKKLFLGFDIVAELDFFSYVEANEDKYQELINQAGLIPDLNTATALCKIFDPGDADPIMKPSIFRVWEIP